MNQQSSHLTDSQIEEYVARNCGEDRGAQEEGIEAHFAECDSCRGRRLEAERIRLGILWPHPAKTPKPGCPGEEQLQEFAAGLCSPETASEIRTHAARCDFCAPLLKSYLEDFSGDLNAEAKEFVDGLPAMQTKWQQRFVRDSVGQRPGFLERLKNLFLFFRAPGLAWRRLSLAGGLALAILAAMLVPGALSVVQIQKAEKLAVNAFVEKPRTNLRFAWLPHNFDIKLSGEDRNDASSSPSWIDAQSLANHHQDSADPKWLRISGRLALLKKDINAVNLLKSAYDKGLRDPATEIDLAAAYFLRDTSEAAKKGQAAPDVGQTVNLLHKVLQEPGLAPEQQQAALFNLAIAYETMLRWDQAISFWEEYLKLDSSGPWADEAGRRLAADQAKKRPLRPQGSKSSDYFEKHFADPETQSLIEEYQDAALRTWFFDRPGSRVSQASQPIHRLAEMLEQGHQDSWMKDFLSHSEAAAMAGVKELGAAITNNRRGFPTEAILDAQTAQKIFKQSGNVPGELRSLFEEMYANQRLWDWPACLDHAQKLQTALRGTSYRWLQIQLALSQAVCLNRHVSFESADEQLRIGFQEAVHFRFYLLELRARGLDASMNVDRNCDETWQKAVAGLEIYWRGPSVPIRLYEFYSPIKQCMSKYKQLWHAAEALERRMIFILENEIDRDDRDMSFEETARTALEEILIHENKSPASIEWSPCYQDPVCARYRLPIKLQLGELQLSLGHLEDARLTLEEAKDPVESTNDDLIRLSFYRIFGDVLLKQQQLEASGSAYKSGLEIAEHAFAGLKSGDKRLAWMKDTEETYRGLVGTLLGQGRNEQALQLWEWYRAHFWDVERNYAGDMDRVSWQQIQNEVSQVPVRTPASGDRVVYAFIKDRIVIWTITSAGMIKMPPAFEIRREKLEQHISDFAKEIGDENSNPVNLEEDSKRLFSYFLEPVVKGFQQSGPVMAELDPWMSKLNLEALESPEGWYFGLKYPVVYSPGLVKEAELRPVSHRPPASKLLLNALTADNRSLTAGLEGVKVLNAFDLGQSAISDHLRESEMFVFIGHGESGALRMPNRKPLQAEDFPSQSLQNLQLAALVACSSGSAQDGVLDTSTLVRAFLSAGVPAVIASRWDVSKDSSTRLISSFNRHFQQGKTAARSMLAARQEVFNAGNTHPYHWAAFSLTGRAPD
ncbi:MAG TPA: CHAT domain-containing protein [Candidatus Angelobacter sp.]|nr:CHAT domain-containing protein [Candidatus Angelobacter sp.]